MVNKIRPGPKWMGKVAVVTGASSGIGAVTAQKLAQKGLQVVMVARRRERLDALVETIRRKGGQAELIVADLADEPERLRVFNHVSSSYGGTQVLVNNAGLGWYGYGAQMPWEIAWQMLQVNVAAAVHLTLLFLGDMKKRGAGHIINIGSIAGSLPSQGIAVYSATKSFLDAFTTALHRESTGSGVHLSIVRAGPVKTEFGKAAAVQANGYPLPTEHMGVTPGAVADAVWRLLNAPRRVVYVPKVLAVTPWIEAFFGRWMDRIGPALLRRHR